VFIDHIVPDYRIKSWLVTACNPLRQAPVSPPCTGFANWCLPKCEAKKQEKPPNPLARTFRGITKRLSFLKRVVKEDREREDHEKKKVKACLRKRHHKEQQKVRMWSVGVASVLLLVFTYEAIIGTLLGFHNPRSRIGLASIILVAVIRGVTVEALTHSTWILLALAAGVVGSTTLHKEQSRWPGQWSRYTWGAVVGLALGAAITFHFSEYKPVEEA